MTLKKKFYVSIFTLLGIVIIAAAALFITWEVIRITYNSSEKTELVDSQITIIRGANGIPGIEASTVKDMYFALGYIHAKDRLDLIEKNRALATGNSSTRWQVQSALHAGQRKLSPALRPNSLSS